MRNAFYICIMNNVCIMMLYGCPQNVNLAHSTKIIAITLLMYNLRVPPGNKNNRVYPMSHRFLIC